MSAHQSAVRIFAAAFPYLAMCQGECPCDLGEPCPVNEAAADELLTYLADAGLIVTTNPNKEMPA